MRKIILIAVLLVGLGVTKVWSQPPPPDDPGDVPIDGGLSWLVAGGIGYGVYRLKRAKSQESEQE